MQLAIHLDALYLSFSQGISWDSGFHFLSEGQPDPQNPEYFILTVNGILLLVFKIIRKIMALE